MPGLFGMTPDESKKIIIISDGTGRTAKRLLDAILAQYAGHEVAFDRESIYSGVRTITELNKILASLEGECLVIFSIISRGLRREFHHRLHEEGILHLNVLEPMLNTMAKFLGFHPKYRPGLLHIVDDSYYAKVDAIGFTVEHDDGLGHKVNEADLVIVGPSRTCKTPISMYIACNHGLKVANIPVFPHEDSKRQILSKVNGIHPCRVFGVTMRPEVLSQIREERSELLGGNAGKEIIESYHNVVSVQDEIEFFNRLCVQQGWEIINVTRRAIEEISTEILRNLSEEFEGIPEEDS